MKNTEQDNQGFPWTSDNLKAIIKGYWRDFLVFLGIKCPCGRWASDYDTARKCECGRRNGY